MRKPGFFLLLLFILTNASAQKATDYRKQQNYKEWVHIAPKFDDDFFKTEEAQRIGDNVLLYQQITGGWPKNIYMPAELTEQEYKAALKAKEDINQSTIDNNATTTEIEYLARLYLATQKEKYKEGVLNGIQYLLKSQYENGGWPQFYPRPKGYYVQITYNDNAMVRVMNQLRSIYEKKAPYTFLPDNICEQARNAFNKGIECILKTQVCQNGELTVCLPDQRPSERRGRPALYALFPGEENEPVRRSERACGMGAQRPDGRQPARRPVRGRGSELLNRGSSLKTPQDAKVLRGFCRRGFIKKERTLFERVRSLASAGRVISPAAFHRSAFRRRRICP